MDKILTSNMIMTALVVGVFGKALTAYIPKSKEKLRKIGIPLILVAFGIGLMCLVTYLNGATNYGDCVIQGIVSSTFSQWAYDKWRENVKRKNNG